MGTGEKEEQQPIPEPHVCDGGGIESCFRGRRLFWFHKTPLIHGDIKIDQSSALCSVWLIDFRSMAWTLPPYVSKGPPERWAM